MIHNSISFRIIYSLQPRQIGHILFNLQILDFYPSPNLLVHERTHRCWQNTDQALFTGSHPRLSAQLLDSVLSQIRVDNVSVSTCKV